MGREVRADLELISLVDTFVKAHQHWITLIGGIATLVALGLTYNKMKKRVERFRDQASREVTIANLESTVDAVEQLLTRKLFGNKGLLQWRMMHLIRLLADIRGDLPLDSLGVTKDFQDLISKAALWEKEITELVHSDQTKIDEKSYRVFLSELKGLLLRVKNHMGIMSKDGKNDTK